MLIAHLSDCHIAAPGQKAYGQVSTDDHLRRCVRHINSLQPAPDLALVTGDITCSGRREEVALARELLGELATPCYVVPGNHDRVETLIDLRNLHRGDVCYRTEGPCFDYLVDNQTICLVGLDSSTPSSPGGEITRAQADWLGKVLADFRYRPTMLFLHHPPVRCGVLETDEDGFAGLDLLAGVLDSFPGILRLFCGHIHLASHVNWQDRMVSTAPSMGLQLFLDLTMTLPSAFVETDPGYYLHYYTPDGNLVTYTMYVRDTQGPYPFSETRTTP
ncbi:metallophosphoesterase [Thermodesulfobacteriota bacterium B35]